MTEPTSPTADQGDGAERYRALADERLAHVRFLEALDRVDRVIQRAPDLEHMMRNVLDELLDMFDCDRAWLLYPCDPATPTWQVQMERTRPEYPGAGAVGRDIPIDPDVAATFRICLDAPGPVTFGLGTDHDVPDMARANSVQSFIAMALRPRTGLPWEFGFYQCAYPRIWEPQEIRLFEEIGRRLSDGLSSLLVQRDLATAERRLRVALEAGTTGVFDLALADGRGTLTAETAVIWGLPPDFDGNLLEYGCSHVHPDDAARIRHEFDELVANGTERELEFRLSLDGGITRWVRWRGQVPPGPDGRGARVVGVNLDITDQKRAAESLAERERTFRLLAENSLDIIARLAPDGTYLYVSPACRPLLGFDAEELIGRSVVSLCHPDDAPAVAATFEGLAARDAAAPTTYRHRRRDGSYVWLESTSRAIRDESTGELTEIQTAGRDISGRKAAEERVQALNRELEAQVQQHRMLLEQASDAIFVSDSERRYIEVNVAACELLGYARDELVGLTVGDITPPDVNAGQETRFDRMKAGERVLSERLLRRKDGTLVVTELNARELPDGRFQAIVRDITARKRLEQEQARLVTAVEQADEAIVITDPSGTILFVNPAFERVSGYPRSELVGGNPRILHSGHHDAAFYEAMWSTLRAGHPWRGTFVNRHRSGALYEEDSVISPVHDADGTLVNYVGVKRDVTRERALEAQLLQTQKMEAVGLLAGGIAHDFNNLITAIRGFSELIRDGLAHEAPERADLDQVILAADRAAELTRQLLAFSRRQVLLPRILDPAHIVGRIAPMLQRLLGADIELVTRATPQTGSVRVDPSQLEQVIVNLAVNSREAMPDGGRLLIETVGAAGGDHLELGGIGLPQGSFVVLRVVDTGRGMDAETCARVFEPFFTTKGPGSGSGMGLATVYGIVKQSGGEVRLLSQPGEGTTFEIWLPRFEDAPTAAPAPTEPEEIPRGSETILLVDDEVGVRQFARRALERLGYTVLEAGDGVEALERVAEHAGAIDVLVTDMVMPRVGGLELAAHLRRGRPSLPVVFTSGFHEIAAGGAAASVLETPVLAKPFTRETLGRAVRRALGARSSG